VTGGTGQYSYLVTIISSPLSRHPYPVTPISQGVPQCSDDAADAVCLPDRIGIRGEIPQAGRQLELGFKFRKGSTTDSQEMEQFPG